MAVPHPGFGPLVVIVDHHEWSARALESVVTASRFTVERAHTIDSGLAKAREPGVSLVFVCHRLSDGTAADFCRQLQDDPRFKSYIPVVVTASEPLARGDRLGLLQAGAWEVLTHPLDAEEIVCKLHTYSRANYEILRAAGDSLVDQLTGLYSRRGLERRALEISSVARRTHQGLVCVAMASSASHDDEWDSIAVTAKRAAEAFKPALRASDALGRLHNTEFAVFAPITDAEGPVKLIRRLADAIRSQEDAEPGFGLCAGYDTVFDAAETATDDLLLHATLALREAKKDSTGDWIRPFEPDTDTV
jgi:PleD family two-component response regulator